MKTKHDNKISKQSFLLIALFLFFVLSTYVNGAGVGTSAVQFLRLKTTARSESLGGALTAVRNDLSGLEINPATVSGMEYAEGLFSQASFFGNKRYSYFAYGQPTRWGVPSIDVMYLGYGNIQSTNRKRDEQGTISPNDSFVGLSWSSNGRVIPIKNLQLGGSVRYVRSNLGSASANLFSFNLGTLYRTPFKNLDLGFAVNNLGSSIRYANEAHPQPRMVRAGLGYSTNEFMMLSYKMRFSVDGVMPASGQTFVAAGIESSIMDLIQIQVGYEGEESVQNRFRFGFGLGTEALRFGYAASPSSKFGVGHRFSVRMRFGKSIWNLKRVLSKDHYFQKDLELARLYLTKRDYDRSKRYSIRALKHRSKSEEAKEILRQINRIKLANLAKEIYKDVEELVKDKHWYEALQKVRECIQMDTNNQKYRVTEKEIAEIVNKEKIIKDSDLARAELTSIEQEYAELKDTGMSQVTNIKALIALAKGSLDSGNPAEALKYIRDVRVELKNIELVLKGEALTARKSKQGAASEDQQVTVQAETAKKKDSSAELTEGAVKKKYERAVKYWKLRKYSQTIEICEEILKDSPKHSDTMDLLVKALRGRGVKHHSERKYEDAYRDFQAALKLQPKNTVLRSFLASTREMMIIGDNQSYE